MHLVRDMPFCSGLQLADFTMHTFRVVTQCALPSKGGRHRLRFRPQVYRGDPEDQEALEQWQQRRLQAQAEGHYIPDAGAAQVAC